VCLRPPMFKSPYGTLWLPRAILMAKEEWEGSSVEVISSMINLAYKDEECPRSERAMRVAYRACLFLATRVHAADKASCLPDDPREEPRSPKYFPGESWWGKDEQAWGRVA
jgi:hypothetical protein